MLLTSERTRPCMARFWRSSLGRSTSSVSPSWRTVMSRGTREGAEVADRRATVDARGRGGILCWRTLGVMPRPRPSHLLMWLPAVLDRHVDARGRFWQGWAKAHLPMRDSGVSRPFPSPHEAQDLAADPALAPRGRTADPGWSRARRRPARRGPGGPWWTASRRAARLRHPLDARDRAGTLGAVLHLHVERATRAVDVVLDVESLDVALGSQDGPPGPPSAWRRHAHVVVHRDVRCGCG